MTYQSLVKKLTDICAAPEHEASEIVYFVTGNTREWCLLNRNTSLPQEVDSIIAKREHGMPLQYILGEAWFFGNRFTVSPDCLIPQPDTEHLVMLALNKKKVGGRFVDLCTGSGCIAISILKENVQAVCTAVDISEKALKIAKKNALDHGVSDRIAFTNADVLTDAVNGIVADADVVVSNPPYIKTNIIAALSDEVRSEPFIALDGGTDGLTFYRHFIVSLTKIMKPGASLLLEIGYDQSEQIALLCSTAGLEFTFYRDFGKNIRVAEITV